ncbi:MAG: LysR family transcriptional regulator [Anaerotardibacter sp.]
MNLSQLRYFRKLAQVQHYTKAAEELFITQPALSNSIKQLEKELGIPLFESQGRNVRLTKWGREFSSYISEGLDIIDKGIQIAQEHADNLSGIIDIGTIFTVQSDYLPGLLLEYRNQYGSQVEVKLYQGLTKTLVEGLENGVYDLVICAYVDNKPNLEFIEILRQDLVAVVDAQSPFAEKDEISLSELQDYAIVTYRNETPVGASVENVLRSYELPVRQRADDEITLGSFVVSNPSCVGISLDTLGLSPFHTIKKLRIKEIPKGFHPVYMAYQKGAYKTRALENMIELGKVYKYEPC